MGLLGCWLIFEENWWSQIKMHEKSSRSSGLCNIFEIREHNLCRNRSTVECATKVADTSGTVSWKFAGSSIIILIYFGHVHGYIWSLTAYMVLCNLFLMPIVAIWQRISWFGFSFYTSVMSGSNLSLASSGVGPGWSCSTLEEGVKECARMAGLDLQAIDAEKASQWPCGGKLTVLLNIWNLNKNPLIKIGLV